MEDVDSEAVSEMCRKGMILFYTGDSEEEGDGDEKEREHEAYGFDESNLDQEDFGEVKREDVAPEVHAKGVDDTFSAVFTEDEQAVESLVLDE